jgi:hypothetical protein
MSLRNRALSVLLWYAIFAWGIWLGGTLYQMAVVVPMWSASPPESLRAFLQATDYNRTVYHFFGPPFIAARIVPMLVALGCGWHLPRHRSRLIVAALCTAAIVIFTLGYIYPINTLLFEQLGGDRPTGEIAAMVRTWIWADRIRLVVGIVAFVAILMAFRLPIPQRET